MVQPTGQIFKQARPVIVDVLRFEGQQLVDVTIWKLGRTVCVYSMVR